jgi:O-antigen biosynthesis protein
MKENVVLDASSLSAAWRVLRRHLRYAAGNPRKLLRIALRIWQIVSSGQLRGVLQRHRVIQDIYRDYAAWTRTEERHAIDRIAGYRSQAAQWPNHPRFSVLMPVYCPPKAFIEQAVQSILDQQYPDWELCIVDDASPVTAHFDWLNALAARDGRVKFIRRTHNGGTAAATNDALAAISGDYCLFVDQDDALDPSALFEFAARIIECPLADMLYADEDHIDSSGVRSRPFFKPDWDPEWIRTTNYVLHPVVMRTTFLRALGGLRTELEGVQDWDVVLRAGEMTKPDAIEHIPHVLYHWREHANSTAAGIGETPGPGSMQERAVRDSIERHGEVAEAEPSGGCWRIRYALPPVPPLVSIVIPTRDRVELLRRCIAGLRERTAYARWEGIIIDNNTADAEALQFLATLATDARFKVIRDERPFNYSSLCNEGVAAANGDVILLLNNDVEPIGPGWLKELVAHAHRPEIGMVGAVLYYPNDTIQHAGVVLGLNGVADRPYIGYPRGFRGVDSRLLCVHTVTAVVTACAAVRRNIYERVGGMDERLPIACNDLDLCLRVAELGYRNVLTPHAELYHHESASRGYQYASAASVQGAADEARFQEKWRGKLHRDRAYNANLTLRGTAYSLAPQPQTGDESVAPAD